MRLTIRILSLLLGATGALILGTTLNASTVVSVKFGPSTITVPAYAGGGSISGALGAAQTAGVVNVGNWNNANTNVSNTTLSSLTADVSGSPLATGANVNYQWAGGPGLANNTAWGWTGSSGNNLLMSSYWGNDQAFAGGAFGGLVQYSTPGQGQNFQVRFTNLKTGAGAPFPNGYKAYVYVVGSGSNNETNLNGGAGGWAGRNAANPVHIVVGDAGTNNIAKNLDEGTNAQVSGVTGPYGTSNGPSAVMPAGIDGTTISASQRALIWPTSHVLASPGGGLPSDYWSAQFYGFNQGTLGGTDPNPVDWWQYVNPVPTIISDSPGGLPASFFIPGTGAGQRNIPVGNYVLFDNLQFDTLEVFSRAIYGASNAGGTGFRGGGIAGIQLVALEVAETVPEPSTYALGLIGLFGLGLVAWRRKK